MHVVGWSLGIRENYNISTRQLETVSGTVLVPLGRNNPTVYAYSADIYIRAHEL